MALPHATVRLDKWLWHARICKSRAIAVDLVTAGRVRLNGAMVTRPARPVGVGDALTLVIGGQVRVVRILAPGTRRGPAAEAALLYRELVPGPRNDSVGDDAI